MSHGERKLLSCCSAALPPSRPGRMPFRRRVVDGRLCPAARRHPLSADRIVERPGIRANRRRPAHASGLMQSGRQGGLLFHRPHRHAHRRDSRRRFRRPPAGWRYRRRPAGLPARLPHPRHGAPRRSRSRRCRMSRCFHSPCGCPLQASVDAAPVRVPSEGPFWAECDTTFAWPCGTPRAAISPAIARCAARPIATGLALYSSPRFTPSDVSASGDRGLDPCRSDWTARQGSRTLFEPAIHALRRFRLGRSRARPLSV